MDTPERIRSPEGAGPFEFARTAVLLIDDDAVVRGWTEGAETLLGHPASETLGRRLAEVLVAADEPAADTRPGGPPEDIASPDGGSRATLLPRTAPRAGDAPPAVTPEEPGRRPRGAAPETGEDAGPERGRPVSPGGDGAPAPTLTERLGSPEGWGGIHAVRHRDGHRLDLEIRILPLHAADGRPFRLLLAADTTRTPWSGAGRSLLDGIAAMAPVGVAIMNTDLRYVWMNEALERMGGIPNDRRIGRTLGEVQPGLAVQAVEAEMRRVLESGEPTVGYEYLGRPQSDLQQEHAYSTSFFRLEDGDGAPLGVCYMVLDITESYRARQKLALLNRAGERIGSTLDVLRTAQELAEMAVPELADFVTVDLLDSVLTGDEPQPGPVDTAALASLRRAAQQSVRDDVPEAVVDVGRPSGYPHTSHVVLTLLSGTSSLVQSLDADLEESAWAAEDPTRAGVMRRHGFHTLMVVPVRARGIFLGAAAFYRWQPKGSFQPDDLLLAEEFVTRAAVAIDNARRYTREHSAALTLQRSLLPNELPGLSAVEAAGRYLPADTGAGVGGDWYDVIPLSGARVGLVVGDVVGQGIHAAATMGRVRASVQTLADMDLAPDELLGRLDDMAGRIAGENQGGPGLTGATCLYAIYDPVTGLCTMARAGHPPPIVVSPAGAARVVDLPAGPPLGLGGTPFEATSLKVPENSLLVFYTNGLILGQGLDTDQGLARLQMALSAPEAPLEELCDALVNGMPVNRPVDDVALLLARTRALAPQTTVTWEIPAEPASVRQARASAARQLADWGLEHLTFCTELVVSELVTNALTHASEPISLRMIRDESLICEVSDGSSTAPHLRHARTTDEGGRGLFLVAQCTKRWGTRYDSEGGKTTWTEQSLRPEGAEESGFGGTGAFADLTDAARIAVGEPQPDPGASGHGARPGSGAV
ncbi:SpoIIE family protein phosphatase [Streptomyces sp. NPDC047108]|uniref:SpoIIE family protein phosphatase n=1 Tax=Streptomyces sp. NPDC047108 TaxID=3155025 RepID=UPI0033C012F8